MANDYNIGKDVGSLKEKIERIEKDITALKGIVQNMQTFMVKKLEDVKNAVDDERSRAAGNL
jgi:archaellum component FlaC